MHVLFQESSGKFKAALENSTGYTYSKQNKPPATSKTLPGQPKSPQFRTFPFEFRISRRKSKDQDLENFTL